MHIGKTSQKKQFEVYNILDYGLQTHYYFMSIKYMISYGFYKWKIDYIKTNYKHINLDFLQTRVAYLFRRAISNPEYNLCKQRLIKEYDELRVIT